MASIPPLALQLAEYPSDHRADVLRPKTIGSPTVRPGVQRRYPRLFRGDVAAGGLLTETFRRRGASLLELAEDLEVAPRLLSQWLRAERSAPLGLVFALTNGRMADAILNAALDLRGDRHGR